MTQDKEYVAIRHVMFIASIFYLCNGIQMSYNAEFHGPSVKVNSGTVVGEYITVLNKTLASFQSIPYAKPPIGVKRFSRPEPIGPWNGILVTRKKPPACMQDSSKNYIWIPSNLPKSEDCLYLNIWVPENQNENDKLPVMVWIHGGGYYAGASSMDIYDGSVLASVGRVIVVNMNYRLGVFGFINSGTNDALGNNGLFDQALALKWVNKNIEKFGGDNSRITIFGESAGSTSVHLHIMSPLSQMFFQRAIMQSGSAYSSTSVDHPELAKEKFRKFSSVVGCIGKTTSAVAACLKSKNATTLSHIESLETSNAIRVFAPSFGNEFIPVSNTKIIKSKYYQAVPLLIGSVKDEATIIPLNYLFPHIFPKYSKPDISLITIKYIIRTLFRDIPLESFDEIISNFIYGDIIQSISNLISYKHFICPSFFFSQSVSEAYYYWITHRSLKNKHAKWTGVEHVSDVLYVFGRPFIDIDDFTDEDRLFSANMITKWANFARNGYPLTNDTSWPRMDASNPKVYELSSGKERVIHFPRKEDCEILKPFIMK